MWCVVLMPVICVINFLRTEICWSKWSKFLIIVSFLDTGSALEVETERQGRLWSAHSYFAPWGRMTDICVSRLTIIGSDNGLSKFIHFHSGKCTGIWKCHLEKWPSFCLGLNVLNNGISVNGPQTQIVKASTDMLLNLDTWNILYGNSYKWVQWSYWVSVNYSCCSIGTYYLSILGYS